MNDLSVGKYIAQCAASGIQQPDDIIKKASKDFESIEKTLHEQEIVASRLRPEKAMLVQVLRTFGAELPRNNKKVITPVITDEVTEDTLDETQSLLVKQFCEFLEKSFKENRPVTARDIMEGLNIKLENDVVVYSMIKWLGLRGIIKRNGGEIIAGDSWEKRPQNK